MNIHKAPEPQPFNICEECDEDRAGYIQQIDKLTKENRELRAQIEAQAAGEGAVCVPVDLLKRARHVVVRIQSKERPYTDLLKFEQEINRYIPASR